MIEKHRLETIIGLALIAGVIMSFLLELLGLFLYYMQFGRFQDLLAVGWRLEGKNFFLYAVGLILSFGSAPNPLSVVALGIVVLILTPYISIIGSAIYFGLTKNFKYLSMTSLVLAVLTMSLALH